MRSIPRSNLKVTDQNFSEVMDAIKEVCETLCMPFVRKLYIRWSYNANAFTAGAESPIIILDFSGSGVLSNSP